MPVCKKCGHENREAHRYCVKCGAEIQLTKEQLEKRVANEAAERGQKALYIFFFFIVFAIIDIAVAYEFPAIVVGGLLIDAIICALLWFTWMGK